jgi:hypothetical protein
MSGYAESTCANAAPTRPGLSADVGGVSPGSPGAGVGGGERSPGADVAGVSPVSPGADVEHRLVRDDLEANERRRAVPVRACVL